MNPHDPLCPEFDDYPLNGYQCCCEVISKARYAGREAGYAEGYDHGTEHGYAAGWRESLAGFREYLEKAVISKCAHTKYEGCRPCIHDELVNIIMGND